MKRSEKLLQEAHAEENDLKFMGKYQKAKRASREETFREKVLPVLDKESSISFSEFQHNCFRIAGKITVDYYPCKGRIFFHKTNANDSYWANIPVHKVLNVLMKKLK